MKDQLPRVRYVEPQVGWRYRWLATDKCPEVELVVIRVMKTRVSMEAPAFIVTFHDKRRALKSPWLQRVRP